MKQKIYIIGLIAVAVLGIAVTFKVNHWAGASILLTLGVFTLTLVFLPLALINNYKAEGSRKTLLLYIVTWVTCLLVFTAMLFKIMHWPGASVLLIVSLPFPFVVFLPVYLAVTSRIDNFNIYNTVFVLFLLAVVSLFNVLLALGVSRNSIELSMDIAKNYSHMERAIAASSPTDISSVYTETEKKKEELLGLIDHCIDQLLEEANLTDGIWAGTTTSLNNLDSKEIVSEVMLGGEEPQLATKLETAMKDYMSALEKNPGNEEELKLLTSLFEIYFPADQTLEWRYRMFTDRYLSWTLVWMKELEVNLRLMM